jgi:hypothetical protein
VLRGRCACNAVAYEVSDEFVAAYNCHCSRGKLSVTKGLDAVMVIGDADADHAMHCGTCLSLLYWTSRDGTYVRVPYGSLVDEPALKPTAHMFVGSKASWHAILDDLPQYDEYPWS